MTPCATIMRMCRVWTMRAALSPMTFTSPAELKAGAAAVRLDGWKMRSMDNTGVCKCLSTTDRLQLHCAVQDF